MQAPLNIKLIKNRGNKMSLKNKSKQKILQKIAEEKTRLISELFAKPSKQRRKEIEDEILRLDQNYMELFE